MALERWSKKAIEERGESHLPYITKEDCDKWVENIIHKKNLQDVQEEEPNDKNN
jgi:hypothetical protein